MARTKRDVVEYRIYDLPVDLPLVVLQGDNWRISDVPSQRLHFHNCLEIGFCHSDSGTLRFEDESVTFQAGDIFMIPRHVPHTTYSAKGCRSLWSYLFLDLEAITVHAAGQSSHRKSLNWVTHYRRLTQKSDPRLYHLCRCLLEESMHEEADREQLLRIYAMAMAAELNRRLNNEVQPPTNSHKVFPLKSALEYIHEHYMEPCDTETLANLCHLSQTHFRRLFLSCMDATPLQFVISTRISQACVLLANTNEPVLTIAQLVGMPSASSFNRNFQQVVGMSPRQYRASSEARAAARPRSEVLPIKGWVLPDQ